VAFLEAIAAIGIFRSGGAGNQKDVLAGGAAATISAGRDCSWSPPPVLIAFGQIHELLAASDSGNGRRDQGRPIIVRECMNFGYWLILGRTLILRGFGTSRWACFLLWRSAEQYSR